jgi:hypothetical protein
VRGEPRASGPGLVTTDEVPSSPGSSDQRSLSAHPGPGGDTVHRPGGVRSSDIHQNRGIPPVHRAGQRGSMTRLHATLPFLVLGAMTAGCSSDSESPPSLCSSVDALQASVADLRDVQVTDDGITAVQDAVAAVRTDLGQVGNDATSQYASQVDELEADFDAVESAAGAAQAAPSADSLRAVVSSIGTLADDVAGFADDVASTC